MVGVALMACVVEGGRAGSSLALGTLGSPPLAERPLPPQFKVSPHRSPPQNLILGSAASVPGLGCCGWVCGLLLFVSSCPLSLECILCLSDPVPGLCAVSVWGEGCRNRSKSAELWAEDGAYSGVAAKGCDQDEGKNVTLSAPGEAGGALAEPSPTGCEGG